MSEAAWIVFWSHLPYLIGALGTCVVPSVTALLLWRAHRMNIKVADATRKEVVATRTQMTEVKGLMTTATEIVKKVEERTNGMHEKIVALTDKEATARGHLAGREAGVAEEKDRQSATTTER